MWPSAAEILHVRFCTSYHICFQQLFIWHHNTHSSATKQMTGATSGCKIIIPRHHSPPFAHPQTRAAQRGPRGRNTSWITASLARSQPNSSQTTAHSSSSPAARSSPPRSSIRAHTHRTPDSCPHAAPHRHHRSMHRRNVGIHVPCVDRRERKARPLVQLGPCDGMRPARVGRR